MYNVVTTMKTMIGMIIPMVDIIMPTVALSGHLTISRIYTRIEHAKDRKLNVNDPIRPLKIILSRNVFSLFTILTLIFYTNTATITMSRRIAIPIATTTRNIPMLCNGLVESIPELSMLLGSYSHVSTASSELGSSSFGFELPPGRRSFILRSKPNSSKRLSGLSNSASTKDLS
jgi:hypothetical protein